MWRASMKIARESSRPCQDQELAQREVEKTPGVSHGRVCCEVQ